MRLIQRCGCILAAVLCSHSAECGIQSNVLQNPGFELGAGDVPSGWTRSSVNASRQGFPVHSGTYAGKLFGNWSTTTNFSYFYQTFPASRGQV